MDTVPQREKVQTAVTILTPKQNKLVGTVIVVRQHDSATSYQVGAEEPANPDRLRNADFKEIELQALYYRCLWYGFSPNFRDAAVRFWPGAPTMVETVLTDSDFSDGKLLKLTPCTLVLAHANLSADDHSAAQILFETALRVALDFPELHVGLLNCLDYPEVAEQLPIYVSEFGTQFAALIYLPDEDPHFTAAVYEEDAESFYFWILGILLARYRPATTREEIIVRIAYDLASEPVREYIGQQWDDVELRKNVINAARDALTSLYEEWLPESEQTALECRMDPIGRK